MIIKSIELKNFRNYEHLELDFDSATNILYGDNAQGKTNVLESAYVCATTKSHKGSRDKDMIRFGEEEAHIRIKLKPFCSIAARSTPALVSSAWTKSSL